MKDGKITNRHDTREAWLRAATQGLREHFEQCGKSLPDNIRFSIAFTSTGRKSKRVGELWHPGASADQSFELFIRADLSDPAEVLGALVGQLVHAALTPNTGHGKDYKALALKIGLEGPMRTARPGPLLQARLAELADTLGPLPHASLGILLNRDGTMPAGRKKQTTRLLKAICSDKKCGYTLRITSKWVEELGAPLCPKHGPMNMEPPAEAA